MFSAKNIYDSPNVVKRSEYSRRGVFWLVNGVVTFNHLEIFDTHYFHKNEYKRSGPEHKK